MCFDKLQLFHLISPFHLFNFLLKCHVYIVCLMTDIHIKKMVELYVKTVVHLKHVTGQAVE